MCHVYEKKCCKFFFKNVEKYIFMIKSISFVSKISFAKHEKLIACERMPVQFFFKKESVEAIPLDTPLEMLLTEALKHLVPNMIFFTSNVKI